MKQKYYSTIEVADILNISKRAVIKRCVKSKIKKKNKVYQVPASMVEQWQSNRSKRTFKVVHKEVPNKVHDKVRSQLHSQSNSENELLRQHIQILSKSNHRILNILDRLNQELVAVKKSQINQGILKPVNFKEEEASASESNKSYHPPNTTEKTKDGKEIPKPSMNSVDFVSNYNPNWNKDLDQDTDY